MKHTERTTRKVEKDVTNAPTDGRLSLVVEVPLWNVLDEGDGQFYVRKDVNKVKHRERGCELNDYCNDNVASPDDCEKDSTEPRDGLGASLKKLN